MQTQPRFAIAVSAPAFGEVSTSGADRAPRALDRLHAATGWTWDADTKVLEQRYNCELRASALILFSQIAFSTAHDCLLTLDGLDVIVRLSVRQQLDGAEDMIARAIEIDSRVASFLRAASQ